VIRVVLPEPLRVLAGVAREVEVHADAPTPAGVLDALEARYPMLQNTIRDARTGKRRPFVRYFACSQDLSHDPPDAVLPPEIVEGREPFIVLGAISGG